MAVSAFHPFTWRQATLTPAARDIFTADFYPPIMGALDLQLVWYAIVEVSPRNHKVIIASDLALNRVRVTTGTLGASILTDVGPCKALDESALNLICEHVRV